MFRQCLAADSLNVQTHRAVGAIQLPDCSTALFDFPSRSRPHGEFSYSVGEDQGYSSINHFTISEIMICARSAFPLAKAASAARTFVLTSAMKQSRNLIACRIASSCSSTCSRGVTSADKSDILL